MKENVYLITYEPFYYSDILVDRIERIGECKNLWTNVYLVKTKLTAKELYENISKGRFETEKIIILKFGKKSEDYFGYLRNNIWNFIDNNLKNASNEIEKRTNELRDADMRQLYNEE